MATPRGKRRPGGKRSASPRRMPHDGQINQSTGRIHPNSSSWHVAHGTLKTGDRVEVKDYGAGIYRGLLGTCLCKQTHIVIGEMLYITWAFSLRMIKAFKTSFLCYCVARYYKCESLNQLLYKYLLLANEVHKPLEFFFFCYCPSKST